MSLVGMVKIPMRPAFWRVCQRYIYKLTGELSTLCASFWRARYCFNRVKFTMQITEQNFVTEPLNSQLFGVMSSAMSWHVHV